MKVEEKRSSAIIKAVIMAVLLAIVIVSVYFILVVRGEKKQSDEDNLVLSDVQEITTLDLDRTYPQTEKDVLDLYGRIMKVLHAGGYTDEEFNTIESKLEGIYDDELLANQTDCYQAIKDEVTQKQEDGYTISNFVVCDDEAIIHKVEDGRDCASARVLYSVKHSGKTMTTYYIYVLRKDDEGRWKILGWSISDGSLTGDSE